MDVALSESCKFIGLWLQRENLSVLIQGVSIFRNEFALSLRSSCSCTGVRLAEHMLQKLLRIPLGVAQSSSWTLKMSVIRDWFNKSWHIHLVEYSNVINCKLIFIGTKRWLWYNAIINLKIYIYSYIHTYTHYICLFWIYTHKRYLDKMLLIAGWWVLCSLNVS